MNFVAYNMDFEPRRFLNKRQSITDSASLQDQEGNMRFLSTKPKGTPYAGSHPVPFWDAAMLIMLFFPMNGCDSDDKEKKVDAGTPI